MKGGKGPSRAKALTCETKSALIQTLHGLRAIITELVMRDDVKYILPAVFQSDRLE